MALVADLTPQTLKGLCAANAGSQQQPKRTRQRMAPVADLTLHILRFDVLQMRAGLAINNSFKSRVQWTNNKTAYQQNTQMLDAPKQK
jgi:hypothetical protein